MARHSQISTQMSAVSRKAKQGDKIMGDKFTCIYRHGFRRGHRQSLGGQKLRRALFVPSFRISATWDLGLKTHLVIIPLRPLQRDCELPLLSCL